MKTAKKKSPTARCLEWLRKEGHYAWVVESTIPKTFIKRDFMGWADVIYLTKTNIVGVQVTAGGSGGQHASRKAKIIAEPRALAWLQAGGLIEVWSFAKQGARGAAKKWTLRREELVAEDFR